MSWNNILRGIWEHYLSYQKSILFSFPNLYSKLWHTKYFVTNIPLQKTKVLYFFPCFPNNVLPFGPYLLSSNFWNESWLCVTKCHHHLVIKDILNVLSFMTPRLPASFGLQTCPHGTKWYLFDVVSTPFQRNLFLIWSIFLWPTFAKWRTYNIVVVQKVPH